MYLPVLLCTHRYLCVPFVTSGYFCVPLGTSGYSVPSVLLCTFWYLWVLLCNPLVFLGTMYLCAVYLCVLFGISVYLSVPPCTFWSVREPGPLKGSFTHFRDVFSPNITLCAQTAFFRPPRLLVFAIVAPLCNHSVASGRHIGKIA